MLQTSREEDRSYTEIADAIRFHSHELPFQGVERHQFPDIPDAFWKDREPIKDAMDLNRRRIAERTKMAALPPPRQFRRPMPQWPGRASGWRAGRSPRHHC